MPSITEEAIIKRIDELLGIDVNATGSTAYGAVNEGLQGALGVVNAVHGRGSQQQANSLGLTARR